MGVAAPDGRGVIIIGESNESEELAVRDEWNVRSPRTNSVRDWRELPAPTPSLEVTAKSSSREYAPPSGE
jgi:hypothetical protein